LKVQMRFPLRLCDMNIAYAQEKSGQRRISVSCKGQLCRIFGVIREQAKTTSLNPNHKLQTNVVEEINRGQLIWTFAKLSRQLSWKSLTIDALSHRSFSRRGTSHATAARSDHRGERPVRAARCTTAGPIASRACPDGGPRDSLG